MKKIRLKIDNGVINQEYWEVVEYKLKKKFVLEYVDEPDYYICNVFDNNYMKYDCVIIQVIGENITPDFNLVDYAVGFDDLIFEDRYLRFPIYFFWKHDFDDAIIKHLRSDDYFLNKRKFCNFIYSNNKWQNEIRNDIFYKLSEYKRVDSGGKVLNNIGYRVDSKREFQENYKFSVACENSRKNGYTTEKIIQAFSAGTIPIYWGNPCINEDFNGDAFINIYDYDTIDNCLDYIKKIDGDDELYLKIQHTPIYKDNTKTLEYIENRDMLVDFLCDIFEQSYASAKRIYNADNGYNSEYKRIIDRGWKTTLFLKRPWRALRNGIQTIPRRIK